MAAGREEDERRKKKKMMMMIKKKKKKKKKKRCLPSSLSFLSSTVWLILRRPRSVRRFGALATSADERSTLLVPHTLRERQEAADKWKKEEKEKKEKKEKKKKKKEQEKTKEELWLGG